MAAGKLAGRNALITGASKGLGKAMALALGKKGANIALVARDTDRLTAVAEEIRANGSDAESYSLDVSNEAAVRELEAAALARFGHIDILINNAGINLRKPVTEFTLEEWNQVVSVNLTSAFLLCRSFVPQMKGRGYGRIINMTSTMGHVSLPGRTAYSATKAALIGFTKALALELANEAITVVGISPGPFATEMNLPLLQNPEVNQQFIANIPVGRWGRVEEIGALAAFLCSDEAAFLTGTDILIDGGWCAR